MSQAKLIVLSWKLTCCALRNDHLVTVIVLKSSDVAEC